MSEDTRTPALWIVVLLLCAAIVVLVLSIEGKRKAYAVRCGSVCAPYAPTGVTPDDTCRCDATTLVRVPTKGTP